MVWWMLNSVAQVYRGLDIASAKVTAEEAQVCLSVLTRLDRFDSLQGVPHRLVDVACPLRDKFDVHAWRTQADSAVCLTSFLFGADPVPCVRIPQIAELTSQNKLPVIVGGTFYWLESMRPSVPGF